jgi:hypothetical protein
VGAGVPRGGPVPGDRRTDDRHAPPGATTHLAAPPPPRLDQRARSPHRSTKRKRSPTIALDHTSAPQNANGQTATPTPTNPVSPLASASSRLTTYPVVRQRRILRPIMS